MFITCAARQAINRPTTKLCRMNPAKNPIYRVLLRSPETLLPGRFGMQSTCSGYMRLHKFQKFLLHMPVKLR